MNLSDLENQAKKLCSSLGITLYDIELRKEKIIITVDRSDNPLNLDELSNISSALMDLIDQDIHTMESQSPYPESSSSRKDANQKVAAPRNAKSTTSTSSYDSDLEVAGDNRGQLFGSAKEDDSRDVLISGDRPVSLELLTLEVTTPGVERHLKRMEHFAQVVDRRIALKLKPTIYHKRRIWGTLEKIDGDTLFFGDVSDTDYADSVSKINKSAKTRNSVGNGKSKVSLATVKDLEQLVQGDTYLSLPSDEANAISSLEHISARINIKDIDSANLYFDWRAVLSEKNSDAAKDLFTEDPTDSLSDVVANPKKGSDPAGYEKIITPETINNLKKMDNGDRRAGNE